MNHYYNYKISAATGAEHKANNYVLKDNDVAEIICSRSESSDNVDQAEDFLTYLLLHKYNRTSPKRHTNIP